MQHDGERYGPQQLGVAGEAPAPQRVSLGANRQRVEELRHHQSGEDHGLPMLGAGEVAPALGTDRQGADEQADPEHVLPGTVAEDALFRCSGRPSHDVSLRRLRGEREAG